MDAPDYLKYIASVAKSHECGLDELGGQLRLAWSQFETYAKVWSYDILMDSDEMQAHLARLLDLLYRAPDVSADLDCDELRRKDEEYGGSWHTRGGQGAFMMLARKWDRIEKQVKNAPQSGSLKSAWTSDRRDEGIADDLGDLRRYLVLCRAWHVARNATRQSDINF